MILLDYLFYKIHRVYNEFFNFKDPELNAKAVVGLIIGFWLAFIKKMIFATSVSIENWYFITAVIILFPIIYFNKAKVKKIEERYRIYTDGSEPHGIIKGILVLALIISSFVVMVYSFID